MTLFVTSFLYGQNTVAAVDQFAGDVIGYVTMADLPQAVAITPDGTRAYVTVGSGDSNSVIQVLGAAAGGPSFIEIIVTIQTETNSTPLYISITPDSTKAYVTAPSQVFVLDVDQTSTNYNTITATFSIPNNQAIGGGAIAIAPDGKVAILTTYSSNVYALNIDENSSGYGSGNLISVPSGGNYDEISAVAFTPDGRCYLVGFASGVTMIYESDLTGPQVFIPMYNVVYGGSGGMYDIAITPDGSRAYLTALNISGIVLDTNAASPTYNTVIAAFPITDKNGIQMQTTSVAIDPLGALAYFGGWENFVELPPGGTIVIEPLGVVDVPQNTQNNPIQLTIQPNQLAFVPRGSNSQSGTGTGSGKLPVITPSFPVGLGSVVVFSIYGPDGTVTLVRMPWWQYASIFGHGRVPPTPPLALAAFFVIVVDRPQRIDQSIEQMLDGMIDGEVVTLIALPASRYSSISRGAHALNTPSFRLASSVSVFNDRVSVETAMREAIGRGLGKGTKSTIAADQKTKTRGTGSSPS